MLKSQPVNEMSKAEWEKICLDLQPYHSVFYKMWHMGKPVFTDEVPTAAVQFDKVGQCVRWLFNPEFWSECSDYKKLFVICHESLHILLNHGMRFNKPEIANISNIAMDVAINHSLVSGFGFIRDQIEGHEKLCWVDTVFPGERIGLHGIPDDESSEFYLKLLRKKNKSVPNASPKSKGQSSQGNKKPGQNEEDQQGDGGKQDQQKEKQGGKDGKNPAPDYETLDSHDFANQGEDFSEIIKNIDKDISNDEKKDLQDFVNKQTQGTPYKGAGANPAGMIHVVPDELLKTKKKTKWETIVKKWSRRTLNNNDFDPEQWARTHRRNQELDRNLFLPSELEQEDYRLDRKRIKVRFYLDVSGSCYHLKDRFFKAAMSLNPKYFDVKLNVFDTAVRAVDLKKSKEVNVGGGTYFDIIESDVQASIKTGDGKHPDAVWVMTDGDDFGALVKPEKPKLWYWFLSEPDYRGRIPKECNKFMLSDFE